MAANYHRIKIYTTEGKATTFKAIMYWPIDQIGMETYHFSIPKPEHSSKPTKPVGWLSR
jgi:hypothetical protein